MDDLMASRDIISEFVDVHSTDIALIDLEQSHACACEKLRRLCESLEDDRLCLEDLVIQIEKLASDVNTLAEKMKHRFGPGKVPEGYVQNSYKIGHLTVSSLMSNKKHLLSFFRNGDDFARTVSPNLCIMGSVLEVWAKLLAGDTDASLDADAWPEATGAWPETRVSGAGSNTLCRLSFVAHAMGAFAGLVTCFLAGAVFAGACK